jgi:hypothetical protein
MLQKQNEPGIVPEGSQHLSGRFSFPGPAERFVVNSGDHQAADFLGSAPQEFEAGPAVEVKGGLQPGVVFVVAQNRENAATGL